MKTAKTLPAWSMAAPLAGWLVLAGTLVGWAGWFLVLVAAALMACVLAAVHHAEVIAHRVGEPFGTLLLAVPARADQQAQADDAVEDDHHRREHRVARQRRRRRAA